jgi:hypothetical protein
MMSRRREFSTDTKRQAYERSHGICECHLIPHVFRVACGCALGPGNTFYEHIDPDAISHRNDLDNCAVLTKTCWRFKTNSHDKPVVAKSNRVRDLARGIKSRIHKPLTGTVASNVKIPLRPFARPINRTTGREF